MTNLEQMEKYAKQYQHENRNKGKVTSITDYSLTFTTNENSKDKGKSYVVMKSYFLDI